MPYGCKVKPFKEDTRETENKIVLAFKSDASVIATPRRVRRTRIYRYDDDDDDARTRTRVRRDENIMFQRAALARRSVKLSDTDTNVKHKTYYKAVRARYYHCRVRIRYVKGARWPFDGRKGDLGTR